MYIDAYWLDGDFMGIYGAWLSIRSELRTTL